MPQSPTLASYLVFQAENNAWSNHRLYAACAALPTDAYFAKRPCFFGSIHNTLYHLLLVDHRYMARIEGRSDPRAAGACRDRRAGLPEPGSRGTRQPVRRAVAALQVRAIPSGSQVLKATTFGKAAVRFETTM